MKPKLFVAGCSFSDYSQVDAVYGELLAEKLGYDYQHEGSGCGSNYRIWRVIGNHIMQGRLNSKDLLIVQYTSMERREFWSHNPANPNEPKKVNLSEPFELGGSLLKYKSYSTQWQRFKEEKDFLELYENYFCSIEYESQWFIIMHAYFQSFLLSREIPTVFLETMYMNNIELENQFAATRLVWMKNLTDTTIQLIPNEDHGHLNIKGHQLLADDLYQHITRQHAQEEHK